ncbi:YqaJ viral recombinase family protein [Simplicispira piscis]
MYQVLEGAPQGSAAWHAARARHLCASEAAAALGLSKYTTRDELLRQKATGLTEEVSPAKQRIFDAGHEAEALARPIAEEIAGTDFYPVVATREVEGMPLLASFDGIDILDELIWENKLLNQSLVQQVQAGDLEPHYYLQLEHQLLVSGAQRALFTTSDGTPEGTHPLWYESKPERRAQLIAGWKQFAADLAAYVPPEPKPAPVVAEAMESLPAVSMRLDGKLVVVSNLPDFATALRAFIERIPEKPDTDQEFANAESACKALKRAEDALTAGEDAALGEMVDFEAMRRQVRDLKELARTTRLTTEKLVAARKEQIRGEIVAGGIAALREHIDQLNAAMPANYMPKVPADFAGAVKGKRTLDSLRGAVNDELARAKIAASEIANRIHANVKTLQASGMVVHDAAALVLKATDDLAAIITNRVATEQQRQEAERERIRKEEQERADREAREKLEAEARDAQASIARAVQQNKIAAPVAADLSGLVAEQCAEAVAGLDARQAIDAAQASAAAAPEIDPDDTITLGQINARLSPIKLDAAGIEALGFTATKVRGTVHFPAAQFPALCRAIAARAMEAATEMAEAA